MPHTFTYREATPDDIPGIMYVRLAVTENTLSDPGIIKDELVAHYLTVRGKGWVCLSDGQIVGFAIGDLEDHNVWALFVHPDFAAQGIGRTLHDTMLNWYFAQTDHTIWLSTTPGTRADTFYRLSGWIETGTYGKGEIRFEMRKADWEVRENA